MNIHVLVNSNKVRVIVEIVINLQERVWNETVLANDPSGIHRVFNKKKITKIKKKKNRIQQTLLKRSMGP